MSYLLFIDYSLLAVIRAMPKAQRSRFERNLESIRNYPGNYAQYTQPDASGRLLSVALFDKFAVYYWIDEADRHIKILRIVERR